MKKIVSVIILLALARLAVAQQYALYNSRTLFDAFENPSQKAFQVDSSRKFAFNFFIPTVSAYAVFKGPAQTSFKDLAFRGRINGNLPLGVNGKNTLVLNSNAYLIMFKLFKDVNFNKELGFSWQLRQYSRLSATNETFAIFDDPERFGNAFYNNIFNNKGTSHAYHQFSLTYREDYNKRLGIGVKLSLLSGIAHHNVEIDRSSFSYDEVNDQFHVDIQGEYRSSIPLNSLDKNAVLPLFKNPGLSFSASTNYKFPHGWFVIGTLKDVGLIRWNKSSYTYPFSGTFSVENTASGSTRTRLGEELSDFVTRQGSKGALTTPTDAKAEILINKDLNRYQPNLILSKNLFYPGGNMALINNFKFNNLMLSASTGYNLTGLFQIGGQVMYRTANFELFGGSDQILQTYYSAKNIINGTSTIGKNYTGASFYIGMGLKFGPSMEHPLNARSIPGIDNTRHVNSGFFRRFFSKLGKAKKKEN
ncbi:MAG TPA: DUF5723 family protein [Sphingobacteriaceae bacterium]